MSKKDYVVFAKMFREFDETTREKTVHPTEAFWKLLCEAVSHFEDGNPSFDRERFLSACGY